MNLNEKTMLANVTIKSVAFRKLDKKATQEVNTANNASYDAGRYNKALISKESLKDINRIAGSIRAYHYENTLAWSDTGGRILPVAKYMDYALKMGEMKEEFNNAVSEFIDNYDEYVEVAKKNLGNLFNPEEYPKKEEIEKKFSVSVSFLPLPVADDFRVVMQNDITKEIKENIEKQYKESISTAMNDVWQRVKDAVSTMQGKLSNPEAVFHKSLVLNICELCESLDAFNIVDDKNLTNIKNEIMEKLCTTEPEILRTDKEIRKTVANDAQDILNTMAGYC